MTNPVKLQSIFERILLTFFDPLPEPADLQRIGHRRTQEGLPKIGPPTGIEKHFAALAGKKEPL